MYIFSVHPPPPFEKNLCTKNLIFDLKILNNLEVSQRDVGQITGNATMFIPGYGLCKEVPYFNISQQLDLISQEEARIESRVFITDKNYKS